MTFVIRCLNAAVLVAPLEHHNRLLSLQHSAVQSPPSSAPSRSEEKQIMSPESCSLDKKCVGVLQSHVIMWTCPVQDLNLIWKLGISHASPSTQGAGCIWQPLKH